MSDTSDQSEPTGEDQPDPGALRERGDKAEAKAAEAEARAEAAERRAVFAEAGIPTEGAGVWFRKAYDGELEPETIKAAFAEGGGAAEAAEPAAAAPPPEGAGVVGTIAPGMAQEPAAQANPQNEIIEGLRELAASGDYAGFDAQLAQLGLRHEPEATVEERMAVLPDHLRPPT